MPDVCLFAHFDKNDKVDEYVYCYLSKIKALNFSIVFISASRLGPPDIDRLHVDCCDVILRENAGLDFASWSAGIAKHRDSITGRLLLANDSVYGPIGSLASAVDRLTSSPADLYGMVESIEITPHIQSWFLLLEPWVARHAVFQEIMAQPFVAMTKPQIILNGEVALSRRLNDAGFKYEALYMPTRAGLMASRCQVHPMHLLWRELLFDVGIPFLKIDLLRDNPLLLTDMENFLREVSLLDVGLVELIKSHLANSSRKESNLAARVTLRTRWRVHSQYAMMRHGYEARRQGRRIVEAWNFAKWHLLLMILRVWRSATKVKVVL
jgi:lipopolysaccharide biosynthesis protein